MTVLSFGLAKYGIEYLGPCRLLQASANAECTVYAHHNMMPGRLAYLAVSDFWCSDTMIGALQYVIRPARQTITNVDCIQMCCLASSNHLVGGAKHVCSRGVGFELHSWAPEGGQKQSADRPVKHPSTGSPALSTPEPT